LLDATKDILPCLVSGLAAALLAHCLF
jgi:hypothetical protein